MISIEPNKLKKLLGQHLIYRDVPCRVIEILEEEPALVLQDRAEQKIIQTNQYGEPSRRAPRVFTVAVFNVRRDGFNPALPEITDLLSLNR